MVPLEGPFVPEGASGYPERIQDCSRWLSVSDTTGNASFRPQHPDGMPASKYKSNRTRFKLCGGRELLTSLSASSTGASHSSTGAWYLLYYGWMSPNSRISLDLVRWLVWLYRGWTFWLASGHVPQNELKPPPTVSCPRCGSAMKLVKVIYKNCLFLVKSSTHQQQPFDDSG